MPTAEERLKEIASKAGCTMRELYEIVNKVYIDDAKFKDRIVEQKTKELQMKQAELAFINYENSIMENTLLAFRLKRAVWWRKKLGLIKTPKTK